MGTAMTKDQALAKLKKCMALSKSANDNEAAAALRQAQKLMAMFDLTDQDIMFSEVNECSVGLRSSSNNAWIRRLGSMVAYCFGVDLIFLSDYKFIGQTLRRVSDVAFFGQGVAPEIAAYAFEVLQRQLVFERKQHIEVHAKRCSAANKTARGDMFAKGWISAVRVKVHELARPVHNPQVLENYAKAKWPNSTTSAGQDKGRGRAVTSNDWAQGMAKGKMANLMNAVGADKQGLLS